MTKTVGVVIPAYEPDVERLRSYVTELRSTVRPSQVRIELDAATDAVTDAVRSMPASANVVPYRRGKGAAITAGFEALETDILAFVDADGSTPADSLVALLEPVREGEARLSVGSRRHPDATVARHQTLARRYLGDGFAWLARRLLAVDLYDYQCGAKAIDATAWAAVREHLYEPGFAWDIELVAMAGALDLRVAEVPIDWYDQPGSTVSPIRTSIRFARTLFSARHRAKQVRDSRLHTALASRRDEPTALVERE